MACFFWLGILGLAFTFAGYFVLIRFLAAWRSRPWRKDLKHAPSVSVVLVIYNERERIVGRLRNLLASTYPQDRLEVVVVSDGSSDDGLALVAGMQEPRIKAVTAERSGKAQCLNLGIAQSQAEIIVFADARQRFESGTIQELAANFQDPEIGAVSGSLEIDPATTAGGSGVDIYWRMEKMIRAAEARFDSSIGCTGAVYAMRRNLFRPLPADTILDDVVNPMQITRQGYRVVFDEAAVAYDPQALDPVREKIRKRRTLAGNFQMLFRHPAWLWPGQNRLWWQLISHKYLRLLGPALMAIVFGSNFLLAGHSALYRSLFIGQCAFYGLAMVGLGMTSIRLKCFSIPAGFCFLNWMVLAGFWHYLSTPRTQGWAGAKP